MPTIYDNIEKNLIDGLVGTLALSTRADFCAGYFNLRGWKEIEPAVEKLPGGPVAEGPVPEKKVEVHRVCRLLVGMQKTPEEILRAHFYGDAPVDQGEAAKLKRRAAEDFKRQLTIGAPDNADEASLRTLSRQMKKGKLTVKLHLRYPLHAKLYLAYSDDLRLPVMGFLGSSNLTFAGLVKQGELNIDVVDKDAAKKLAAWFDERWNDRWCFDITKELTEAIDTSWAREDPLPPYYIYLKIAYHLSREARAGMDEFKLPKVFQDELLDFQQKAVLVAAHHLNKRGGVLIGDVVGLGKTIVATALAKLFEEDYFLETLIICPKNLVPMWESYTEKYRLVGKVISISMVQRELPELRRYRTVIIDESHNLRNSEGARWKAIKDYLDLNKSNVILLTATPYNKNYLDLSNQLRLFIMDDQDLGISPEAYIKRLGGAPQFNSKHTETFIRGIKAFEKSDHTDDWQELMRLFLVRRTRSFIKANYAARDKEQNRYYLLFSDGRKSYFPERIPKKVEYKFDAADSADIYARLYSEDVVAKINSLDLPRYGLQLFRDEKAKFPPTETEEKVFNNMNRAGKRLMGFCRTNLFKRLESSGYSFLLSLERHVLRNYIFVYALNENKPLPIGKNITQNLDDFLEDEDIEEEENHEPHEPHERFLFTPEAYLKRAAAVYTLFSADAHKKQFDWIRGGFFTEELRKALIKDSNTILEVLKLGKDWNAENDRQLNALHQLIAEKHKDDKIIVFTQFSDTAHYLAEELRKRGVKNLEPVTGSDEDPTEKAFRFSPKSNADSGLARSAGRTFTPIRVLISTDVLSEGQNLQDAHIVVNYDLPWAIIRLIQRAGRVDRIGQEAPEILCYSFLPEDGIEKIIRLRSRLSRRIEENANVVGSDETFFDGDPVNLADLYNEKAGVMDDDEDDGEVDLASQAYQIWKNAVDANPAYEKLIPDLPNNIYATMPIAPGGGGKEGAIVYVRTGDDTDLLSWIDTEGGIITQSQSAILKAAFCTEKTPAMERLANHHDLVKKGVQLALEEEKNTGTALGKKTGIKYQVYMRLDRYCRENAGTLLVTDSLKNAVDDILKNPLTESAKDSFNRQFKMGADDAQIAGMAAALREEGKLVIASDKPETEREPQIICSLGLRKTEDMK